MAEHGPWDDQCEVCGQSGDPKPGEYPCETCTRPTVHDDDRPRNDMSYEDAMHAMQSGVAAKMNIELNETQPKHLRVGVNSAMVDTAAITRLLVEKGVFTYEEFGEALRLEANREVDKYEDWLRKRLDNSNLKLR